MCRNSSVSYCTDAVAVAFFQTCTFLNLLAGGIVVAAYNLRKWKLGVHGSRALGAVDRTEDAET